MSPNEFQSMKELQAANQELKSKIEQLNQRNAELKRANNQLENLLVSIEVGTLFLDLDLRIQYYNAKLEEIFDITPEDLGQSILYLTDKIEFGDLFSDLLRFSDTSETIEREMRTTDGSWFLVRMKSYRTPNDIAGLVINFVDITERKQTAEELTDALEERVGRRTAELERKNGELENEINRRKKLEKKIIELSARHQRSLGERLHDNLVQQLYGVQMLVQGFLQRTKSGAKIEIEEIEQLSNYLVAAEKEARNLAQGMIPVQLEKGAHNLVAVLERLAERTCELWESVDCRVESSGAVIVGDEFTALKLYYIAQEAINNALKHGKPSNIVVRLKAGDRGEIILEVEDDGIGIQGILKKNRGLGIEIMKHRAELINAQLEIKRGEEGGTLVRCTLSPQKDPSYSENAGLFS